MGSSRPIPKPQVGLRDTGPLFSEIAYAPYMQKVSVDQAAPPG